MAARKTDPVTRFWRQVRQSPDSECWLWTGSKQWGYGRFWDGQRIVGAHRWAYWYMVDDDLPPAPWGIDHLCSVPACVNPLHLELVPGDVNMKRSVVRGRWRGIYNHPDDVPPDPPYTHSTAQYVQAVDKVKGMVAAGLLVPPITPHDMRGFRLGAASHRAALSWLAAAGLATDEFLIPPQPKPQPSPITHEGYYQKPGIMGHVQFVSGDPGVHIVLATGHLLWATTEEYNTKPREELDQEIADLAAAGVGVFVKEKT